MKARIIQRQAGSCQASSEVKSWPLGSGEEDGGKTLVRATCSEHHATIYRLGRSMRRFEHALRV